MQKTILLAVLCSAVFVLAACQPGQMTNATLPSDEPGLETPAPRATSTVTSAPAVTPTSPILTLPPATLPHVPTADFSLQDVLGIWTRSDPDRGDLYMIFTEEGTYTASHGTPDGVVHSGSFTLESSLFTFLDGWNCSPEPDDTRGKYVVRLGGGRFLYFDLYEDTCPDRLEALNGFRWERVTRTPTPVP